MKKSLWIIILCIAIINNTSAQSLFQKLYSISSNYKASCLQSLDSGYFVLGTSQNKFDVTKFDKFGDILWSNNYANFYKASSFIQTTDSGLIAVGYSTSPFDLHVFKIDALGNLAWHIALDITFGDIESPIIKLNDGNYLIGVTNVNAQTYYLKISENGTIIYKKKFIRNAGLSIANTKPTLDDGFISVGYNSNGSESFFIKHDENGDVEWGKVVTNSFRFLNLTTYNSNYLFLGYDFAGHTCVLNCDQNGDFVWGKIYNASNNMINTEITLYSDNQIIIGGWYDRLNPVYSYSYLVSSIDSNGNVNWSKTYGGPHGNMKLSSVIPTIDSCILVSGTETESVLWNSYNNVYLLKLDSLGNSECYATDINMTWLNYNLTFNSFSYDDPATTFNLFTPITLNQNSNSVSIINSSCSFNSIHTNNFEELCTVFPNPSDGKFTFNMTKGIMSGKFSIYDVNNKLIYSASLDDFNGAENFNLYIPNGFYTWLLNDSENEKHFKGKLIIINN